MRHLKINLWYCDFADFRSFKIDNITSYMGIYFRMEN